MTAARFCSLFFIALALGPAFAHLFALPNKIGLSHDDYLIVQHIYNGWALLGVVVLGALASTLVLAIMLRNRRRQFGLALSAFICITLTQAIFWIWTFPANQATQNWTMLPADWQSLRAQWEYSHAASALLTLLALVLLILCMLVPLRERDARQRVLGLSS